MEKTLNIKRENWIDVIKGFAIILVVLGHISKPGEFITNWIYSFHIPIFFMVTGILLSVNEKWKSENFADIARRKAKSLLYPYFIFCCLAVVIDLIINRSITSAILIVFQTCYFYGANTLWFLPALLIAECLFILIHKSKLSDIAGYICILAITVLVAYFYTKNVSEQTGVLKYLFSMINVVNHSLIGSVFVFFGYILNKYFISLYCKNSEKSKKDIFVFIVSIVVFILNIFLCQYNGIIDTRFSKINNASMYYLFAVTSSLAIICIIKFVFNRCAFFEFFGKNSLIVMTTHMLFLLIPLSEKILDLLNLNISIPIINYLIQLVIVMAVEVLMILFINRCMPFLIRMPKKRK